MQNFSGSWCWRELLALALLVASSPICAHAQKVAGPPSPQQLVPEQGEPIEDDPTGRHIWMRERFAGDAPGQGAIPLDYKDMMLRETQRQNELYPQLAPGSQPTLFSGPTWTSIGPTNAAFETNGVTLNVVDSGRARTILPDPSNQNIVYLLTSGGGLWKTTNFLQTNPTWVAKTDALTTTGGGSATFGRTSNVLYLGLGDPFDDFPLAGGFVTKSIDSGDTWSAVISLANATSIRDIKVDTSGVNDIVMVATDAGFFRSTNGGTTYDSSANASFGGRALWSLAKTSAGWLASAVDGGNNGSLWLSVDQGATWTQTGTGFSGAGRSTLGIGAAGDTVVYAFAATAGNGTQLDLFRSTDGGQNWTALNITAMTPTNPNADQGDMNLMDGQAFYNQMILVDPTDVSRNTVYLGGNLSTARTTNGGSTWTLVTNWLPRTGINLPYAHADFHAAAISTLTSPAKLFFGSDGGLFVSNDGGSTWDSKKNVGIVSHLVYALTSNPTSPNSTIIGLQDNGSRIRESNTTIYDQTIGGDGFGVGTSQANANWTLSSYVNDAISRSTDLGSTWASANSGINTGDAPFSTAITNPVASADSNGTVFFTTGNHNIYETTDGAGSWSSIGASGSGGINAARVIRPLVHVVGVSPVDTNHIAVAGNGGVLLLTTNGGTSWTEVPLNSAVAGYASFNASIAWVNNSILYVCSEAPSIGAVRVVKSVNGGATWTAANSGLPDVSVSKLQVDPNDNTGNTLYAATFIGVYQSTDGGASWHKFGGGLPNVHVTDMYVPANGSFLRISTYGRGIWEIPLTAPPTISKSFGAASIPLNGSTFLSFTITNPNAGSSLTGVGFTDTLPAGLAVATPNGLTGSCGAGTITATAGAGVVSLSGGTINQNASCSFSVNVIGTAAGTKNNITGNVTSTEGGTGNTAPATLKVEAPPTIGKAFGAANIPLSGTTSLTFTFTNPAANPDPLTGIAFTDSLPAGLVVATPNGLTGSCLTVAGSVTNAGSVTAVAGSSSISMSALALTSGGSCTFAVNVTGTTNGTKNNTTGAVTSTNGGSGGTASASIVVGPAADISVTLTHAPDPAAIGGRLTFTATVANNGPNSANVSFTASFTGNLQIISAGSTQGTCSGAGPVNCSLGTMSNGQTVTVTIVVTPLLGRNIMGTATATPDVPDLNPGNNTATSTARVRFKPQRY